MPDTCPRCGVVLIEYKIIALDRPYTSLYPCPKCAPIVYRTILEAPTASDQRLYLDWLRDHAGQTAPHRLEILAGMGM